ncbi:MAG: type II toxin-antitoxin system VapB family antitoxin [Candidatus Sulfotelmatobacter sp.]
MALSIKNVDTERMAREVAAKTGESITEAIQKSLEERLARLRQEKQSRVAQAQIEEILRRVDQLPILDARTTDEIIGYDENGIPR